MAAAAPLPALLGCGGEPAFDAREFAAEANRHDAGIRVGEPLSSTDPRHEVYAVELEPAQGEARAPAGAPHHGTGGSLTVTEDEGAAEAEFERCQQGGLLCYRAANVVLIFEPDADAAALRRLADALRKMSSQ